MPTTDASRIPLRKAIAYKQSGRFTSSLWMLASSTVNLSAGDLPPYAQMVRVLLDFRFHASLGDGISKYFTAWEPDRPTQPGDSSHLVREWSLRIGARRAVAYLDDAVALFPDGRLPAHQFDRSTAAFDIYRKGKGLRAIDARHEGALADLVDRLRAFIADHVDDVERDLGLAVAKAPPPPTVASVLEISDRAKFMQVLADLDTRHSGLSFRERPEPVGMLGGLWALYDDVSRDGMRKFLDQEEGAGFHESIDWCARVGAKRAVAHLREVAKLFPRGRVPTSQKQRFAVTSKLGQQVSIRDPLDALTKLDRKYAGSMDDLADRVRAWVRAHRAEIERALNAALDKPKPKRPQRDATYRRAVERGRRDAEKRQKEHDEKLAHIGAVDMKTSLARVEAFVDALVGLDAKQWRTVAERLDAGNRSFNRARSATSSVSIDVIMKRVPVPRSFTTTLMDPALKLRERALAVIAELPETVTSSTGPLPLRRAARLAVVEASVALVHFDLLPSYSGGPAALRAILGLFEGLAPVPDVPGVGQAKGRR